MKSPKHDDNASIATDIIILVAVLGLVAFVIWFLVFMVDWTSFIENIFYGGIGLIGGTTAALFNLGKDIGKFTNPFDKNSNVRQFAEDYNPVTEFKKNKKKKGRKWYWLYLN